MPLSGYHFFLAISRASPVCGDCANGCQLPLFHRRPFAFYFQQLAPRRGRFIPGFVGSQILKLQSGFELDPAQDIFRLRATPTQRSHWLYIFFCGQLPDVRPSGDYPKSFTSTSWALRCHVAISPLQKGSFVRRSLKCETPDAASRSVTVRKKRRLSAAGRRAMIEATKRHCEAFRKVAGRNRDSRAEAVISRAVREHHTVAPW